MDAREHFPQPVEVHRFFEAVADGLGDERVIGDLAIARDVLETCRRVGEDRRQQVGGEHPLQLRRELLPAAAAWNRERQRGVPAPPRLEHRRVEKRLHEHVARRLGVQIAEDVGERERVLRPEREHQRVFRRGGLQLEVELTAEALPQREPPCPVHTAAEGRVQHELHAARFVEEPLEDERPLRRNHAERAVSLGEIRKRLVGGVQGQARLRREPRNEILPAEAGSREPRIHRRAQVAHRARQLVAPGRRLPEPERNVGRRAMRVGDADRARAHLQHTPRRVAELKDVARHRLDREVLVQGADERVARIDDDPVVRDLGDRAARGLREQPRAAAAAHQAVDFVAMDQRGAAAAPRREAVRRHREHGVEVASLEVAIRPRAAHEREQLVFGVLAAARFGDDLLREHVQRRIVRDDRVQFAAPDGPEQRRALDQIVARRRKDASLRRARDRVAGSADALEQRGDPVRRSDLADEIHVADVDAKFERRRRDERAQAAALQPRLGVEPCFFREAAVVRGDGVLAKPIAQVPRQPLRHPPRVDEHQRRPVVADQRGEPVVVLLPDFVRHHGVERRPRDLDREIHLAAVSFVYHRAAAAGGQIIRDLRDWLLRGRQADAQERTFGNLLQALEGERKVRAAPRADHRVDLVHDDGANRVEHLTAALGRQQQVQRLGRRDEDVRRRAQHRRALRLRRVAGAHGGRDPWRRKARRFGVAPDRAPRLRQVLVDVGAQRLERRDVHHADFIGERRDERVARQFVERGQERGQRLTGAGRRGDERVAPVTNRRPSAQLRGCRRTDGRREPALNDGMESGKRHGPQKRRMATAYHSARATDAHGGISHRCTQINPNSFEIKPKTHWSYLCSSVCICGLILRRSSVAYNGGHAISHVSSH